MTNKEQPRLARLRAILDAADRRIKEGNSLTHKQLWSKVESSDRARAEAAGKKPRDMTKSLVNQASRERERPE